MQKLKSQWVLTQAYLDGTSTGLGHLWLVASFLCSMIIPFAVKNDACAKCCIIAP